MKTTFFIFLMVSPVVFAAGGSGGDHGLTEHQIQTIIYQAINISVLFIAAFFFLRKPAQQFFRNKHETFKIESNKAQQLLNEAKAQQNELTEKIRKLESTTQESIMRARAEAADLKKQIIHEAELGAQKIMDEAKAVAMIESNKAKNMLRVQLIKQASELARDQMKSKVSAEDHKRLQGDFIENIKAVRQ